MLLDKPYWLMNLLGIKYDHFSSLIQAEYQFQNSNVGGKLLDFMSVMPFSKNGAFSDRSGFGIWKCHGEIG